MGCLASVGLLIAVVLYAQAYHLEPVTALLLGCGWLVLSVCLLALED